MWETSRWFPNGYAFLVESCVKPLLSANPDPAVLDAQAVQFHKLGGILDARLAHHPWVCGNAPTVADIALAAPMHMHMHMHMHTELNLPLAGHPHLQRWMTDRIKALPCWQSTFVPGFTLTHPMA